MHYTSDIATCLLTYEESLLSHPWKDTPAVHVGKLREIAARHFASLSPEEFALLRRIMILHASYVQPESLYEPPNEDPMADAYKAEDFRTGTLTAIEDFLKLLRRGMDDSERSQLQYEFPSGKLPEDVSEILNMTYGEILKDYANGCYISAIALCGKVLETCLGSVVMLNSTIGGSVVPGGFSIALLYTYSLERLAGAA